MSCICSNFATRKRTHFCGFTAVEFYAFVLHVVIIFVDNMLPSRCKTKVAIFHSRDRKKLRDESFSMCKCEGWGFNRLN